MNTSVLRETDDGTAQGIGFAISAETLAPRIAVLRSGLFGAEPTPALASDWRVYRNSQAGYSISIAPGWTSSLQRDGALVIERGDEAFLTVYVVSESPGMSIDDIVDRTLALRKSEATEIFEFISRSNIVLMSGWSAAMLEYRWQSDDEYCEEHDLEILILDEDISFDLFTTVCKEDFARFESDVTGMLDSFAPDGVAPASTATVTPTSTPTRAPIPTPTPTLTPTPTRSPTAAPTVAVNCTNLLGRKHVGYVHNTTFNVRSPVVAELEQSGCALKGELAIEPPLIGSGPLVGTIDGDAVRFTVAGDTNDAGVTIEFRGTVSITGLSGTYSVPARGVEGVWELTYAPLASASTVAGTSFGPTYGTMVHDPNDGVLPSLDSETDLVNLVAEADFAVPFSFSARTWSSGFVFRRIGLYHHVVILRSTGEWSHIVRKGSVESQENLQTQSATQINTGLGETNHLRVFAIGDEGWLFINGEFVGELDLSGQMQSGSVLAIGAWVSGEEIPGQATEFNGFTVRSLQRAFGPLDGEIAHDPEAGTIQWHNSGSGVRDAVIEVRFFNPYAVS